MVKFVISGIVTIVLALIYGSCGNIESSNKTSNTKGEKIATAINTALPAVQKTPATFERTASLAAIKQKIQSGEALVIHAFVPLCDNENQGIVPVSASLGNGLDLRSNLYWGAKYGVKHFFKSYTDWKLLTANKDVSPGILERLVFYREFDNAAKVYLVTDAYRGDEMKKCVTDYLQTIAGRKPESITANGQSIEIGSAADLFIFNGHNGLMDYDIEFQVSSDQRIRESAVIGCVSHSYFKDHLLHAKGYPILMTTNLMAPEAYVMNAAIDAWVNLSSGVEIRTEVGKAYHKYQKCGIKGATRLFRTGW